MIRKHIEKVLFFENRWRGDCGSKTDGEGDLWRTATKESIDTTRGPTGVRAERELCIDDGDDGDDGRSASAESGRISNARRRDESAGKGESGVLMASASKGF